MSNFFDKLIYFLSNCRMPNKKTYFNLGNSMKFPLRINCEIDEFFIGDKIKIKK